MSNLAEALLFANRCADEAGRIALTYFRKPLDVEHKADDSPVTIADRGIERFLREQIAQTYPDHGVYGEEEAPVHLESDHIWVVDPIDGTKSFVTGHPLFGGLMALLEGGAPILGQIDIPALRERWCGVAGEQTTMNGVPCKTSGCADLSQAFAYTTDPMLFSGPKNSALEMLREKARLIRFGGDCYTYALLASGYCDLVLETALEPYDYLPVVQVVRGAGGEISDWYGNPLSVHSDGNVLASATPELHAQTLGLLAELRATQAA